MLLRAIDKFFSHEASGGILLMLAAVAALIVANSGLAPMYEAVLGAKLSVTVNGEGLAKATILWRRVMMLLQMLLSSNRLDASQTLIYLPTMKCSNNVADSLTVARLAVGRRLRIKFQSRPLGRLLIRITRTPSDNWSTNNQKLLLLLLWWLNPKCSSKSTALTPKLPLRVITLPSGPVKKSNRQPKEESPW